MSDDNADTAPNKTSPERTPVAIMANRPLDTSIASSPTEARNEYLGATSSGVHYPSIPRPSDTRRTAALAGVGLQLAVDTSNSGTAANGVGSELEIVTVKRAVWLYSPDRAPHGDTDTVEALVYSDRVDSPERAD